MNLDSNTGRYRAMSRKALERALHRSSDAIVIHLRYAGSDVGARPHGSQQPGDDEPVRED